MNVFIFRFPEDIGKPQRGLLGKYYILNTFEMLGSLGTTGSVLNDHIYSKVLWFSVKE